MVDVTRTFTVQRPQSQVVTYLRDFSHAVHWDPGTQSCEQIGDGPIGLGTRWHNVSKLYGISTELEYELTRDDPDHVVMTGRNKTATSTDDLSFRSAGPSSTEITYHAHVEFNGIAKAADPLAQLAFNRLAGSVPKQLTETLESLPKA
jgi:carbon monoxide dehydrogenase subunit G